MEFKRKLVLGATITCLAITSRMVNAAEAWYGGGDYDGSHMVRGTGAPDYPQVHNAVGATNISDTVTTLTGMLLATGCAPAEAWVHWARADGGRNLATWSAAAGAGSHLFVGAALFTPLTHEIEVDPGANYYYRFFATNTAGQSGWAPVTIHFRTAAPPVVSTGPGAGVGITEAVLHAELTLGIEAHIWIDWGAAAAPGQAPTEPLATVDLGVRTVAGTLEIPNPYRHRIVALAPASTYAYRLRAENEWGVAESPWVWFATHPAGFAATEGLAWFGGGYYDGYDWSKALQMLDRVLRGTLLILQ